MPPDTSPLFLLLAALALTLGLASLGLTFRTRRLLLRSRYVTRVEWLGALDAPGVPATYNTACPNCGHRWGSHRALVFVDARRGFVELSCPSLGCPCGGRVRLVRAPELHEGGGEALAVEEGAYDPEKGDRGPGAAS